MMTRGVWTGPIVASLLLACPGAVVAQPLKFTAAPLQANLNPHTKKFDVGLTGTFERVSCPLQVQFTIRQTDLATGTKSDEYRAPLIVPVREQVGMPGNFGNQPPRLGSVYALLSEWTRCRIDYQRAIAGLAVWVVETFGRDTQEGLTRNVNNPSIGEFVGFCAIPTYDTTKFRYEMKVEFWSNDNFMGPYKDAAGNEWTPVPRP